MIRTPLSHRTSYVSAGLLSRNVRAWWHLRRSRIIGGLILDAVLAIRIIRAIS